MKNLIQALTAQARKELSTFKKEVKTETVETILNTWSYKDLITPAKKLKKWKIGELRAYLIQRKTAQVERRLQEKIRRIKTIEQAKDVREITITVEWTKSRTWGNNPKAEICVMYTDGTHERFNSKSIGGCGYDKESTAIAEALNQCNGLLKAMYTQKNRPCNIKRQNREVFSYGSGYGLLPNFEGGVGVSCYRDNFNSIKMKFDSVTHGKTFDVYSAVKKK